MIEIRIPEKKSLNTILRMHFHAKKDLQDLFTQEVMVAKNKKKIKAISGFPLKFTYTFYLTGKELDIVNCCGMLKNIEDALRYNKILINDSPKYVSELRILERKSNQVYSYCTIEWEKQI